MEINLDSLKQEREQVNEGFVTQLFNKCLGNLNYNNRQGKYECYVELDDNECKFIKKVIPMLEKEGIMSCESSSTNTETLESYNYIYMNWSKDIKEAKSKIRWEKYGAFYCLGILLGIPLSAVFIGVVIGMIISLFKMLF